MTAALACPFCRVTLEEKEGEIKICPGCGTPHHADCFEENGGCTVFGCTAAPAPETKVNIAAVELNSTQPERSVPQAQRPLPPPPPVSTPEATRPLFSSIAYTPPQPLAYIASAWSSAGSAAVAGNMAYSDKNRTTFMVLGIVLGAFGAHSFYVGSTKKGILQLALTLITLGFGGLMVWIWAIIDVCTITNDHNGLSLRN